MLIFIYTDHISITAFFGILAGRTGISLLHGRAAGTSARPAPASAAGDGAGSRGDCARACRAVSSSAAFTGDSKATIGLTGCVFVRRSPSRGHHDGGLSALRAILHAVRGVSTSGANRTPNGSTKTHEVA